MNCITILIADDAESVCSALATLLQRNGHRILVAYNGEEAVRKAEGEAPDVILLDVTMPVLDGWGALQQLKADPQTKGIPVLALTALPVSQEKLHTAGFAGCLRKPVPPHLLTEEIERVCGRAA